MSDDNWRTADGSLDIEAVRSYARQHGGALPPEVEAQTVDRTEKVLAEAERIRRDA